MADIRVEKKENKSVVILNGDITVEHSDLLRNALLESLEGTDLIEVDFRNATTVDLSCLQLLCSAHRTSVNAGKSIELRPDHTEILKEAVRESGYPRYIGCTLETEKSCLWKGV